MEKVNISQKFSLFNEQWSPKIVAELNGQHVKLARLQGEFIWHKHDAEDEMFFVVEGCLQMHFRDKIIELNAGEFLVVPRGIEHKPVAKNEVKIMLFEPASTLNTGDIVNERTVADLSRI